MDDASPETEEMEPMEEKSSIEIDPAQLGGVEYGAGEMLQLKVVGHTAEGKLQCEAVHPEDKKSDGWEADFDKSMAPPEENAEATNGGGAEMAA